MATPGFFSFRPTRVQFYLITVLVLTALCWTLFLTGFREYWGFWQSPEVYRFLKKEYSEWFKDYVRDYYELINVCTMILFVGWFMLAARKVRSAATERAFYWSLMLIVLLTAMQSAIIGVRCKNNFATFLDRGEFHGNIDRFSK